MAGGITGGVRAQAFPLPELFDPLGNPIDIDAIVRMQLAQPGRQRAYCKVYMNGQDITSNLDPLLISCRITDRKYGSSTANLTLDDSYGKIPNPPDGARCQIALGWNAEGSIKRFSGTLSNIVSLGQRPTGRLLEVEFTSYNQGGDGKTNVAMGFGGGKDAPGGGQDIPFEKMAKELAKAAGLPNLVIDPSIGNIMRKSWKVQGEPAFGALERLARDLGGALKVDGDNAGISVPGSGKAADGSALDNIPCIVGENVIAWRIIPSVARAQWGSLAHGFFDRDKAAKLLGQATPDGGRGFGSVLAKRLGAFPTDDKAVAETSAKADGQTSVQKRGTGWTIIDGEPKCMAGGNSDLNGYRPGVDGKYLNEEVEHSYYRGGGYTTRIDVERPELYAGGGVAKQFPGAPN